MKNALNTPVADGITRRDGLMLTLLGSALTLAGCGGGGGSSAGVSSGGTGSFSAGPITGFGSIMVGKLRIEDSTASSILDVDDDNKDMRGKMKMGMYVRVRRGKAKPDNRADADSIEVRSELLGPIDSFPSPQTSPPTMVVLGQTVQITATTFFDDGLAGLPALAVGQIVEVHGFVDPLTHLLTATRIEGKLLTNVKAFKLQGLVKGLNTGAQTFNIGPLTISFAASVNQPASLVLSNDLLVRVRLEPTLTVPTTGIRKALKIRAVEVEVEDRDEAEVEGTITAFTSSSKFSVNGLPVDASGAAFPNGTAGIVLRARVEVEGSLVNGVLVATKVKLDDENDQLKFELHGTVSKLTPTTFTLTSSGGLAVNVTYSSTLISNLADGSRVEVKGVASTPGTNTIKATRIKFE